jgi:hypothetical protein
MYRRFDWLLGIHLQACLLRIYLEKKEKTGWLHFNFDSTTSTTCLVLCTNTTC